MIQAPYSNGIPDERQPGDTPQRAMAGEAWVDAGTEFGGRDGPEPTRFGDWEKNGRCIDF
jgi:hypothetical protein